MGRLTFGSENALHCFCSANIKSLIAYNEGALNGAVDARWASAGLARIYTRPDRATDRRGRVVPLFSKSAYTMVQHSETQSYFTSPHHGTRAAGQFVFLTH
jgi:hypothetical protein